jgi:hypothetical protein
MSWTLLGAGIPALPADHNKKALVLLLHQVALQPSLGILLAYI